MTADSSKSQRCNARDAEARWQKVWDARGIFATANSDPPAGRSSMAGEGPRPRYNVRP